MERLEFIKANEHSVSSRTVGDFLMAHIVDRYLKGNDNDVLYFRPMLFFQIRYESIPYHEGKDVGPESETIRNYKKYTRDCHHHGKRSN